MDKQIIFWLWLQCCLGVDNFRMHRIFETFDDAQQIYLADENELKISGAFSETEISKLNNKNLDTAKKMYNNSLMLGYDIFSFKDINYPKSLKNIPTPPVVIYVSGKLPSDNKKFVSIVGTRHSTKLGRDTAFSLAYNLAKNDIVIVSGGAVGIDMHSHRGAIQAGGETVCVLGCGINYNYLPENEELRKEITKYGAVISEYPPFYPPRKYTFPKRNRIISGISDCTVIVEAGKTSGALITARYAIKQNKTVFAVPGNVNNVSSQGSNILIREGARTILNYNDILNWYEKRKDTLNVNDKSDTIITEKFIPNIIDTVKIKESKNNKKKPTDKQQLNKNTNKVKENNDNIVSEQLTDNALAVYHTISDIPIYVDDIKLRTGLKINEILTALTELEMEGFIILQSGRRYIRK